jgi:hypothetical protein
MVFSTFVTRLPHKKCDNSLDLHGAVATARSLTRTLKVDCIPSLKTSSFTVLATARPELQ